MAGNSLSYNAHGYLVTDEAQLKRENLERLARDRDRLLSSPPSLANDREQDEWEDRASAYVRERAGTFLERISEEPDQEQDFEEPEEQVEPEFSSYGEVEKEPGGPVYAHGSAPDPLARLAALRRYRR